MDNIGITIKDYLKQNGITQQMVASTLGKSQPQIAAYLSGKRPFGKNMAKAFHDAYGFSYTFLITGQGNLFDTTTEEKEMSATNMDVDAGESPESAEYWKAKYETIKDENDKLHELLKVALGGSNMNVSPKEDVG